MPQAPNVIRFHLGYQNQRGIRTVQQDAVAEPAYIGVDFREGENG
jgi:hypothetical protein